MGRQISAASATRWASYWTFVVKKDLSQKAKLTNVPLVYIIALTYDFKRWAVTEKIILAEMSVLHGMVGKESSGERSA